MRPLKVLNRRLAEEETTSAEKIPNHAGGALKFIYFLMRRFLRKEVYNTGNVCGNFSMDG